MDFDQIEKLEPSYRGLWIRLWPGYGNFACNYMIDIKIPSEGIPTYNLVLIIIDQKTIIKSANDVDYRIKSIEMMPKSQSGIFEKSVQKKLKKIRALKSGTYGKIARDGSETVVEWSSFGDYGKVKYHNLFSDGTPDRKGAVLNDLIDYFRAEFSISSLLDRHSEGLIKPVGIDSDHPSNRASTRSLNLWQKMAAFISSIFR